MVVVVVVLVVYLFLAVAVMLAALFQQAERSRKIQEQWDQDRADRL